MDKKNFNRLMIVFTLFIALVLTYLFKKTITSNETYIILPMWFLFSEILFNLFKKYTQLKNTNIVIILTSTISFVITFIVTIYVVHFNSFQIIDNFTLWASIAGILLIYTEAFKESRR